MKCTNFIFLSLICVTANAIELQPTFRQDNYKHIAFSASIGGSSHHHWVLSIMDNLAQRGHNLSYLTTVKKIFSFNYDRTKMT